VPILRDDLSARLVHLTRGDPTLTAAVGFFQIVRERRLRDRLLGRSASPTIGIVTPCTSIREPKGLPMLP
jgi:hypothetical protein